MDLVQKTFAVGLTIPDNEAFTAYETLRRIGLPIGGVRRATIWAFAVERAAAAALAGTIATLEAVFNPNKHALTERAAGRPERGEVWIAVRDEPPRATVGGRTIAGVRQIDRLTAWQLFDGDGASVDAAILDRAVETFLCNPAFQKAIR